MQKYLLNLTLSGHNRVFQAIICAETFSEAAGLAMDWMNTRKFEQSPYIVETHGDIFNAVVTNFEVEALGLVANLWSRSKAHLIDAFQGELSSDYYDVQLMLMRHTSVVPEVAKRLKHVLGIDADKAFEPIIKVLGK